MQGNEERAVVLGFLGLVGVGIRMRGRGLEAKAREGLEDVGQFLWGCKNRKQKCLLFRFIRSEELSLICI